MFMWFCFSSHWLIANDIWRAIIILFLIKDQLQEKYITDEAIAGTPLKKQLHSG